MSHTTPTTTTTKSIPIRTQKKMHIVRLFGAIKKKLSPSRRLSEDDDIFSSNNNNGTIGGTRKCHSTSNTPRGRRNSSSSSPRYSVSSSGGCGGGEEMVIEEGCLQQFAWDEEKIRANINSKKQPQPPLNNNNTNRSSLETTNNRKASSPTTTNRKLFSKYKRSSSVNSCLDQLANSEGGANRQKATSTRRSTEKKHSPRFDFFSKRRKRKSSSDLGKHSNSYPCGQSSDKPSSSSSPEEIDYSEFNLRIPSSRTLNLLLSEPKPVLPPSPTTTTTISTNRNSTTDSNTTTTDTINSTTSNNTTDGSKQTMALDPNNHSMHTSSSSFDAFFEDYSNAVLDNSSNSNSSSCNTSSKSLSSLANTSNGDELCSMKSFKRTPSSAKSTNTTNTKQQQQKKDVQQQQHPCECNSSLKMQHNNHRLANRDVAAISGHNNGTFSPSSSSTSIELMGEDTLLKYGIVRISFEPLTSNTITTPLQQSSPLPHQPTTAELLEKL